MKENLTPDNQERSYAGGTTKSSEGGSVGSFLPPPPFNLTASPPPPSEGGGQGALQMSGGNKNETNFPVNGDDGTLPQDMAVISGRAKQEFMMGKGWILKPVNPNIPKYYLTHKDVPHDPQDPQAIFLRKSPDSVRETQTIRPQFLYYSTAPGKEGVWVQGNVMEGVEHDSGAQWVSYFFRYQDVYRVGQPDQLVVPVGEIASGLFWAFENGKGAIFPGTDEPALFHFAKATRGMFPKVSAYYQEKYGLDLYGQLLTEVKGEELRQALTLMDIDRLDYAPEVLETQKAGGVQTESTVLADLDTKAKAGERSAEQLAAGLPIRYYGQITFTTRMALIKMIANRKQVGGGRETLLSQLIGSLPLSEHIRFYDQLMVDDGALMEELNTSLDDESRILFYSFLNAGVMKSLLEADGPARNHQSDDIRTLLDGGKESVAAKETNDGTSKPMQVFPFATYGVVRSNFRCETDYNVTFKGGKVQVTLLKEPPTHDLALLAGLPVELATGITTLLTGGKTVELHPTEIVCIKMIHRDQDLGDTAIAGGGGPDFQLLYMPAMNLKMLDQMEDESEWEKFQQVGMIAAATAAMVTTGNPAWLMVEALDLAATIADAVISDYRYELSQTKEGRDFLAVWEPFSLLVGVFGIADLVLSAPHLILSLTKVLGGMIKWAAKNAPDLAEALRSLWREVKGVQAQMDVAKAEGKLGDVTGKNKGVETTGDGEKGVGLLADGGNRSKHPNKTNKFMGTGAKPGVEKSEEAIVDGTIKMELHPNFKDLIEQAEIRGYTIEYESGSPHVTIREVVNEEGEIISLEKILFLQKDMRYLDLEHEVGHIKQMDRFGDDLLPTERVRRTWDEQNQPIDMELKSQPGLMKPWHNTIIEYHNRLDEFNRLAERSQNINLLQEHADGVFDWKEKHYRIGLNKGHSSSQRSWAYKYFPDIGKKQSQFFSHLNRLGLEKNEVKGRGFTL